MTDHEYQNWNFTDDQILHASRLFFDDPTQFEKMVKVLRAKLKKMEQALEKIRNCDWPGPASFMGSRADWMQKLAREALE